MQATRRLRFLADGLFSPGLNGPLRRLFMEGVVLQLLACQMSSQIRQARLLTRQERAAVTTAHRLMLLDMRSEEHTSELQSLMRISYAVFCLKKKNNTL